jgi:hypothetical protein
MRMRVMMERGRRKTCDLLRILARREEIPHRFCDPLPFVTDRIRHAPAVGVIALCAEDQVLAALAAIR